MLKNEDFEGVRFYMSILKIEIKSPMYFNDFIRTVIAGLMIVFILGSAGVTLADERIQPYVSNPFYWQYQGEPKMLIGASDKDNIFQWTGSKLTEHLDLMSSVGGNYVRNSLSDRKPGDVFAVKKLDSGYYDIDQWNDEYWDRLKFFLKETSSRNIVVQLTLWDWFDLSGSDNYGRFSVHPLNPENNVSWNEGTIGEASDFFGGSLRENNQEVLSYQHRYIDKVMSIALQYDHILYNINNESSVGPDWENYWAKYIQSLAQKSDKTIYVTNMKLVADLSVRHAMTFRDLYSFVDVSQNNQDALGAVGRRHWENLMHWRGMIGSSPRGPMPINNVKVYGEGIGANVIAGTQKEAIERFWRNIFGGSAATRFHRPGLSERDEGSGGWGIGLSKAGQHTLKGAAMFLEEFDLFSASPYEGIRTLGQGIASDYALANIGKEYAVYFPAGLISVNLDPWVFVDKVSIRWLNLADLTWSDEEVVELQWNQYDDDLPYTQQLIELAAPQPGIKLVSSSGNAAIALVRVIE